MHFRLLMALCFVATLAFSQTSKPLYSLTVIVKDSVTHQPLEDATVEVTKHSDAHLTDAKGVVVFDTLRAGHYHITATFVGYYNYETIIELPGKQTVTILLCPTAYHLHETIVEGEKSNENATYSLQSNAILGQAQIEKLRGQNLGELLKNVNGITTLSTGPGIAKPVLRGLHSNRLVMLNNGVKQEEQQWGGEHAPAIDPFAIGKIEVIKGAASVEYGPEAIGGAIRLSPRAYRSATGVDGELSLQALSNNKQGAADVMVQGTHLKKQQLSWRAEGSLRKAGDSRAPDYVISNTGFNQQNGSFSVRYSFSKLQLEAMMSVFNTQIGIMRAAHIGSSTDLENAILSNKPLIIKPFTYNIGKPYQQVWHETQSVKIAYPLAAGRLSFQAGRQLNSRQEYDLGVSWNPQSGTKPAYDLTLTTYTYDGLFEHAKWKKITGKWGASLMHQSNYTAGTQRAIIPNFIANTYGVFAFEKWSKGRWTVEVGARFDQREQTIYTRGIANVIVTESKNFQRGTGIVGASYSFTEDLRLNTTVSSAWRPPSVNELYSNGLHNGTATYEIGNSSLIPERSINADLTLKYQQPKWMLEASLFQNTIRDFIYQVPVQPPTITLRGTFPAFLFTQTNVVMRGGELNSSYVLSRSLLATGNLSYLYAEDVSMNAPLIYMPANRARLGLQYKGNTLWKFEECSAGLNWQFVAQQKLYVAGLDYKNPPPAYHLLDLNIGFEIPWQKQHIRVSASVQNLLNTSYRDYLNRFRYFTDEAGRNFVLRLTIPFTILQSKS